MFQGRLFAGKLFAGRLFRTVRHVVETIHGGGYDFLDPEWHKKRIPPQVRNLIKSVARKAAGTRYKAATNDAQGDFYNEWAQWLRSSLEREQIAWNQFYQKFLEQQIDAQILAQIRIQFELLGLYQKIEEDDEQAVLLMLMEL